VTYMWKLDSEKMLSTGSSRVVPWPGTVKQGNELLIFVPDSVKNGDRCDVLTSKGKLQGIFGLSPSMHVLFENTPYTIKSGALKPGMNKFVYEDGSLGLYEVELDVCQTVLQHICPSTEQRFRMYDQTRDKTPPKLEFSTRVCFISEDAKPQSKKYIFEFINNSPSSTHGFKPVPATKAYIRLYRFPSAQTSSHFEIPQLIASMMICPGESANVDIRNDIQFFVHKALGFEWFGEDILFGPDSSEGGHGARYEKYLDEATGKERIWNKKKGPGDSITWPVAHGNLQAVPMLRKDF